jgi:ATP-dependent exoDNAse (exonuclease V), alpha subunit - helicase superfamily I member
MAAERYLSDKMIKELGFKPTECQNNLFNTLGTFLLSTPETWLMVISGYAGTGKTTAIAAFISVLKSLKYKFILLAPTGRSAKVLTNYTKENAKTIHKQIYRQKSLKDGLGQFSLDLNKIKTPYLL